MFIKRLFYSLLLLLSSALYAETSRWIVVTTINPPTPQLKKLANMPGWRIVVVGDRKTPSDWALDNCDYLSPERQLSLGYKLTTLLPWNHYSRKMIGYLYAIEHGATLIYDTDDDNEPYDALSPLAEMPMQSLFSEDLCLNVYAYFGLPHVWPRGFPLEDISKSQIFLLSEAQRPLIGIEQGMVNLEPDVDAIFRLIHGQEQFFSQKPSIFLPKGTYCPFNSQNTYVHPIAFFTLYLPSSVSMRVSDIWRGYISQRLLWNRNAHIAFSGPSALQIRNEHNLLKDFEDEWQLYTQAGKLVHFLNAWPSSDPTPAALLTLIDQLITHNFLSAPERELVAAWLDDLKTVGAY